MGLDWGSKTLGIAISDPSRLIANGYKTICYTNEEDLLPILAEIIKTYEIGKIILGLPKNMDNTMSKNANHILEFKQLLEDNFYIEVILEDERMTTIIGDNMLIKADVSRTKRKKVIDKIAATIILQGYLDRERNEKE